MTIAPWLVLAPGIGIMLAVLGFNLLGDAQRGRRPRSAVRGGAGVSGSVRIAAIQARPVSETFDDIWDGADVARAVSLLEDAARAATVRLLPRALPARGEAERARRRASASSWPGLIEGTRARWHNTATVIGPDGRILGQQPKCF